MPPIQRFANPLYRALRLLAPAQQFADLSKRAPSWRRFPHAQLAPPNLRSAAPATQSDTAVLREKEAAWPKDAVVANLEEIAHVQEAVAHGLPTVVDTARAVDAAHVGTQAHEAALRRDADEHRKGHNFAAMVLRARLGLASLPVGLPSDSQSLDSKAISNLGGAQCDLEVCHFQCEIAPPRRGRKFLQAKAPQQLR